MLSFKKISILIATFVYLLTASNALFAQQQTVTVHPEQPQRGETVTITYHPDSPEAKITSPDSLKLVLSYAPYLYNVQDEMAMEKTENGWSVGFKLSERFKFATFYFKSGEKVDKNKKGHEYQFLAYKNGHPVKGAILMEASRVDNRYKEESEMIQGDIRAHLIAKELALYPDNYRAQIDWFTFLLEQKYVDSAAVKAKAYAVIENKLAEDPGSWSTVRLVKTGYRKIGEKAKADSIQQLMVKRYPQSDIAMYDLYKKSSDQKEKQKEIQMLLKYVNADYERSFINRLYTEYALAKLSEYYAKQGSIEMMKKYGERYLNPEKPTVNDLIKSEDYKSAARTIAENTEEYELALKYAQKALELTDEEPARTITTLYGRKPRLVSAEREKEILNDRKSEILSTLGFIYTKMEEYEKAAEKLAEARKLSDDESILKDLVQLYEVTQKPQKAYNIHREMLLKKPFDEELRNQLKENYIVLNGSEEGFEAELQAIEIEWREATIAEFKEEMMDKEPPSLASVIDLQGNALDISTLEDKIVVIDFWATWCGPCMSAFPYVQNVYEKYEDNPNVKFVILNSAWSNSIEDAIKWTKEGDYAENEYTFPLYYDKNSKVTTAFGVRGIPTTFILGKDGNIKFKHVGYPGPLLEQKLALRIEMLLNPKTLASGQ